MRKSSAVRADELAAGLAEREIETRPLFYPLHKLPPFREESQQRGEHLPVTDDLAASAIMLPTYNLLTDAELVRIAGAIADVRKTRMKRRHRRGGSCNAAGAALQYVLARSTSF